MTSALDLSKLLKQRPIRKDEPLSYIILHLGSLRKRLWQERVQRRSFFEGKVVLTQFKVVHLLFMKFLTRTNIQSVKFIATVKTACIIRNKFGEYFWSNSIFGISFQAHRASNMQTTDCVHLCLNQVCTSKTRFLELSSIITVDTNK